MNRLIFAASVAALALAGTPALAETAAERGEAKFAELTEGRVAGEGRSCISAMRSSDVRVIKHLGIAYEQGDTLWLARAQNPNSLGYNDVPIFERFGSQLCKTDLMRTVDRHSQFFTGTVFLDDFIPYTKVETAAG